MSTPASPTFEKPVLLRFHYAEPGRGSGPITYSFAHPTPQQAIGEIHPLEEPPSSPPVPPDQGLEVLFIPAAFRDDSRWKEGTREWLMAARGSAETLAVRAGELYAQWRPARAVVIAPAHGALAAIESVVDYSYHEAALQQLEATIAGSWSAAEADIPLAYAITRRDLENDRQIGQRMRGVLQSRLNLGRLEPRLLRPAPRLPPAARDLGEALREAALCEDRVETADGQIEAQEYIYELTSQRIGEHRHARQGFILETIIIILLTVEVVLMIGAILLGLE